MKCAGRCGREMIPYQLWTALPESARKVLKATHVRAHARGICPACYEWALRHDELIDAEPRRLTTEEILDEVQYMDRRGEGLTDQQIADRLKIHLRTFRRHMTRARQRGLIT